MRGWWRTCSAECERKWYNIPVNLKGATESGSRRSKGVKAMKKIKRQMPTVEILQGKTVSSYEVLVSAIENLVQDARAGIKAAMNAIMLQTYWRTGEYIVEYEQNGADRAKYGTSLIRCLARDLTLRLGKGFSRSNLQYMRKFYLVSQKSQTSGFFGKGQTFGFLTWSHYLEILRADDPLEIASTSCICRTRINCAASWKHCLMMRLEVRSRWRAGAPCRRTSCL